MRISDFVPSMFYFCSRLQKRSLKEKSKVERKRHDPSECKILDGTSSMHLIRWKPGFELLQPCIKITSLKHDIIAPRYHRTPTRSGDDAHLDKRRRMTFGSLLCLLNRRCSHWTSKSSSSYVSLYAILASIAENDILDASDGSIPEELPFALSSARYFER